MLLLSTNHILKCSRLVMTKASVTIPCKHTDALVPPSCLKSVKFLEQVQNCGSAADTKGLSKSVLRLEIETPLALRVPLRKQWEELLT